MENASKALLMAAGVLIVILIVSVFMFFINQVSDYQKTNEDAIKDSQLSTFNEQFAQYARKDLKGVDIISVVNKVVNFNQKNSGAGEIDYTQKITITVTLGQSFRDRYPIGDSSLELFKSDTYKIITRDNDIYKVISAQKQLEDTYTLKNLDKLSSNYEALRVRYAPENGEDQSNGKTVKEIIGKDLEINDYKIFLNQILQHREYAEFKTASFTIVGEPTYVNGQISSMEFAFKP